MTFERISHVQPHRFNGPIASVGRSTLERDFRNAITHGLGGRVASRQSNGNSDEEKTHVGIGD